VDDEVVEHVADRARNFGRSAQDVGVVPVRKDLALAVHHAVQPPGDADGQPLQTARELFRVGRLDDQVQASSDKSAAAKRSARTAVPIPVPAITKRR
jgi:hypothetical protein